jgi:DNA-binding transcriptional MerR regulator
MGRDGLLIGELARRGGVSRKALRLYEARGILPKPRRTPSGYRLFPPDALGVLHFVTRARRLGLTLAEIGGIVALRCARPGPCVHVRALLERKVADLEAMQHELRRILDAWDVASRRRGVVCQHIEDEGGDITWNESRSAHRATIARKSSWKATSFASARARTPSPSRRRNGTSS